MIQQHLDALVVHDLCAHDLCLEYEAFGVYQQMSLTALYLLPAIVAALFSTHAGRLDRLAIDYSSTGLRVSLEAHPHPLAQSGMHSCPCSVQAKLSEVVVDATPRWEIVRKQAPGAAAPYYVEDGVKNLAKRIDPRTATGFGSGKMRLQPGPFGIGE